MTETTPVINCRNVWKMFGNEPEKYLSQMPKDHTFEAIRNDGYIAGVEGRIDRSSTRGNARDHGVVWIR